MWHAMFFIVTIELYFAWAFHKYMTHWVFGIFFCKLMFVTCNMCYMWHVTHVICNIFIITIEMYWAWAFQKYMTHRVFVKIVCNLIFVTCNMCDMWHVTCNMHCIALHCIVLHYIALHYIALHCIYCYLKMLIWYISTWGMKKEKEKEEKNHCLMLTGLRQ